MNKWKKPLGVIAGIGFIILLVFVVNILLFHKIPLPLHCEIDFQDERR